MMLELVIVIAAMLIIGLGTTYLQKYTGINIGIPINENVTISGLSLAAIVGIILNAILNRNNNKNKDLLSLGLIVRGDF